MHRAVRLLLALSCALSIAFPRVAWGACARPNLLAGVTPPDRAALTDGVVAREGSPWPPPDVALAIRGAVTWDLGAVERIGPVFFQADADAPIDLEASVDGETWSKVAIAPDPSASGMLGRIVALRRPARFLRLSTPHPSKTFVASEVVAACDEVPRGWGPEVHLVGAASPERAASAGLPPSQVDAIKLVLVLATGAVLLFARRFVRRRALVAIAAIAIGAYANFGAFHAPGFVHEHDVFHYLLGSRYFPELGYTGLYDCATAAEAEAGFVSRIELRAERDLRTNALVSGKEILARAPECRARFSPDRWTRFTRDVRAFADARDVNDWHRVLKDHGFNASPAWIAASVPFSRTGASPELVAAFDPLLLALAFAAIGWAFGLEAACVAIVVFACNPLADFAWTGGAFLRQLWLAALVAGVCLLARGRGALSGVALGLAAVLQLFPVVCLGTVAVLAALEWRRERAVDRVARRTLAAGAITLALVIPLAGLATGRAGAWSEFVDNTGKHAATPSANLVGLRSLLSFRPSTRADVLFDESAVDPFAKVRSARTENYAPLRIVHLLAVVGALAAFVVAARRAPRPPWWWAAAAGVLLVPIALETSSYYTAFLVVAALLFVRQRAIAAPILAALGGALVARLAGAENDVYYAIASGMLVFAAGAALVLASRARMTPS